MVYTALFAALCCVVTACIAIPLPYGYINAGDITVLLAAFCLGPLFGGIAAGLGAALSDILLGYVIYAPATALIKFAVAMLAALIFRSLSRLSAKKGVRIVFCLLSCLIGEAVMVLGYFIYELALYGLGGAILTVPGNALQGAVCAVGAMILSVSLAALPPIKRLFHNLEL
jgi:uncharacterized membrane protein